MQILRFQTAAFFKNSSERPDLLSANMPPELLALFDLIPQINPIPPIPQGIPNIPDFPIVTLQSSHQGYQGTISRNRADLVYTYSVRKDYSKLLLELSEYSERFIEHFSLKQQINRIGIVVTAFIPEENAVKAIGKRYTSRELHNSEELKVRFNKREQKNGIRFNNIVSISSDKVSFENKTPIPGIIIECDINNIPSSTQLTNEECRTIFSHAFERYTEEGVRKLIL